MTQLNNASSLGLPPQASHCAHASIMEAAMPDTRFQADAIMPARASALHVITHTHASYTAHGHFSLHGVQNSWPQRSNRSRRTLLSEPSALNFGDGSLPLFPVSPPPTANFSAALLTSSRLLGSFAPPGGALISVLVFMFSMPFVLLVRSSAVGTAVWVLLRLLDA